MAQRVPNPRNIKGLTNEKYGVQYEDNGKANRMNDQITEKTQEFLEACKEAGYERVTIFVHDKRVPESVRIKKESACGSYWGNGKRGDPFRVVCAAPPQRGAHHHLPGVGWPKMWDIVKRTGLHPTGAGNGDAHNVLCPETLTAGYYDLAEV